MPEPVKIVVSTAPQPVKTIVVTSRVAIAGSGGDVDGPASATDDNLASFDGTTGKIIQDSGISKASVQTAISEAGTALQPGDAPTAHASSHVTGGTDKIRDATASQDGLATAAQITKLDAITGTNTGDQNLFRTIAVSGQSDIVADSTTDTLTIVAGANIVITTNATTDTLTIAGNAGDVVGPASATDNSLARFDGTTGKLIQSSGATLTDAGELTLVGPVNITGGGNDLIVAGNAAAMQFSTFPYFAFGTPKVGVLTGNNAFTIEWTPSGGYIDTSDVGITRGAIGVVKITDGSTGDGSLETLSVIFAGGPTDTTGTGSPESVVTAVVGSTYRRTDGGTNTTLYRKESGTGNTGWVAVSNAGGGGGDVIGPASSVDGEIALFDLTTGKLIKRATGTGPVKVTSGVFSTGNINLASEVTGTLPVANGGTGITSLGTGIATFLGTPSSANLAAALTDETGSGAAVFGTSPTLTTPTIAGAITFPDDVRQTFNPGTTNAGLNVGALSGDPSTPSNGDLWYDSTANELTARINGANVALGSGGGGSGVVFLDFDAASKIPRTTNGSGVDSTETTTNRVNRDLLTFDPASIEYAQRWFIWPDGWATAKATFFWSCGTGTGSVVWGAQIKIYTDGDANDSAFGTAQTVVDAAASADTHRQTSATSGITPAGTVTAGKRGCLQVYRDPTNGSDDMALDALLMGVLLEKDS